MAKSRPRSPHANLPTFLSTFIGREREIAEVEHLLEIKRLVTLTGPGGSGKTRLALQVAYRLQKKYEDGVWLVELASLSDGTLIAQTVASCLNVHEQPGQTLIETLVEHLFLRHTLLVVDNCEHLIQACAPFINAILQRCPNLHVLATSREMLGITGETVWVIPPLTLPEVQPWKNPEGAQNALNVYLQSEAVQLFVNRASALVQDFSLNTEDAAWVSEICRRLDGMPLAIELAAARVRTLSAQQIAEHLDDRFYLLTEGSRTAEPRQQTLAATLDWSYALLSESERKILQMLSVFSGGCTLDAAQAICSGEGIDVYELLGLLSSLVEKSLVLVDKPEGGQKRYRLLETIRQYAGEKLVDSGKATETKNHHLNYFLRWTEQAIPHFFRSEQFVWLERMEVEHDNIRAALEWSQITVNGAILGLRLASAMGYFWKLRSYHTEGRVRIAAALAQVGAQQDTVIRAHALYQASVLAFFQSDFLESHTLAEECLVIARKLGDAGRLDTANALEMLAEFATETGDYSTAPKLYKEALALYREVGDLVGIGDTLKMIGWSAMRAGNYEKAEPWFNEGLIVCRQSGDLRQIGSALAGLGELAIRRGQYKRAHELLEESLKVHQSAREKWGTAIAFGSLGWIALRQHNYKKMRELLSESISVRMETGDRSGIAWCFEKLAEADHERSLHRQSVILFGAAFALRASVSSAMDAVDRPAYERIISELQTALGKEAFEAAWTKGQAMALEQAIDYALAETEPTKHEVTQTKRLGGLTEREREVAVLIAQGKSNRQIAATLTVGVKTVETYVTRILRKLGFDSRVQIATWAMENGLHGKELQ